MPVQKQPLINSGLPLLTRPTLTDHGSADEVTDLVKTDLLDADAGLPLQLALTVVTRQNAVSPGTGKIWNLRYAFSDRDLALENAGGILKPRQQTLACALNDSSSQDELEHAATVTVTGRYFYIWWKQPASFDLGATIAVDVYAKRLN